MKRALKAALSAFFALAVAIFPGMTLASADAATATQYYFKPEEAIPSTTNLPSSFLIGDSEGIRVGVDGEYYIHCPSVIPGDVYNKRLTIQNLDAGTPESVIPYTLTMRAEPLFNVGPVDLLDVMDLELKLDGQVIYKGRLRGDQGVNMIETPLQLGVYKPGDQKTLDIKLTARPDWEIGYEVSVAEFKWIFYAWRETPPDAPQTGIAQYGAIGLAGGVALMWVFLILNKKKKEREEIIPAQ